MKSKMTLAAVAAVITGGAALLAAPQAANATPQLGDSKQVTKSNVEQAGYRYHRRYGRRGGYYGHRRYYRRPGFGIYLGF
jgi:hypothetical protein